MDLYKILGLPKSMLKFIPTVIEPSFTKPFESQAFLNARNNAFRKH